MRRRRRRADRDPRITGVVALVAAGALIGLTIQHDLPFVAEDGQNITIEVAAARQVNAKTPVRVKGIAVGEVRAVRYDAKRRRSEIDVRVTDERIRLKEDARAAVRWRTVLGGRMEIVLDPGSPSAPPLDGDRITAQRTRIQTELEDVTRTFDGSGARGTQALLQELPRGLDGGAAGAVIEALDPGLLALRPALRAVRGVHEGDLTRLVARGARAASSLEQTGEALGELIDAASTTFATTAADREEIAATFRGAPAALAATRRTTANIDRTLPDLDRLVRDLDPAARALAPTLRRARPVVVQLRQVLGDAQPVVRRLRPAVARLASASSSGRRLLGALEPTLKRAEQQHLPYLESVDGDARRPVYQLIGPTFSTLAAAGGLFHDTGHIVNFPVQPSENSVNLLPCTLFLSDPTAAQKVRCATLQRGLRAMLTGRRRSRR